MKIAVLIWLTVVFSACATNYHPKSNTSETQIEEDIFEIRYHGNSYTPIERTADFALLRSAEVVLENGFRFFIIASENNFKLGGHSYSFWNHKFPYGNYAYRSIPTGKSDSGLGSRLPTTVITIRCFKENPKMKGFTFDALSLTQSIKQKYGIDS